MKKSRERKSVKCSRDLWSKSSWQTSVNSSATSIGNSFSFKPIKLLIKLAGNWHKLRRAAMLAGFLRLSQRSLPNQNTAFSNRSLHEGSPLSQLARSRSSQRWVKHLHASLRFRTCSRAAWPKRRTQKLTPTKLQDWAKGNSQNRNKPPTHWTTPSATKWAIHHASSMAPKRTQ